MALGMMGRGPAPMRGRLSPEQRQEIRDLRETEGRGAARQLRREMRQEAGLPVRNAEQSPIMPAQQAPMRPAMTMGQPTGDMMAYRPMPTMPPAQQQPMPIQDMMYRGPVNMQQPMQPQPLQAQPMPQMNYQPFMPYRPYGM